MSALLSALLACVALAGAAPLQQVRGPRFVLDLRYATSDNFLKKDVYGAFGLDRCWTRPELAAALRRADKELRAEGLKLVFWDCWRPLSVQRAMWALVPDERYVANPAKGSNHNRGAAVDVTLADAEGRPLPMPTGFDDFSPAAGTAYACQPADETKCRNRDKLRDILGKAGLSPLKTEWWHFQLPKAERFPIVPALPSAKK